MSRIALIISVALVLAFGAGLAIAKRVMPRVPQVSTTAPPPITSGQGVTIKFSDKPVPMPAMLLVDLDGKVISPEPWKGKVVLLNFWATWCGPCREEIPALEALQERYRDQLVVVGLSVDTGPAEDVKKYVTRVGVNYPMAIVDDKLQAKFGGISAVPATFVVKPDGTIVTRHVGLIDPVLIEQEVRVLANLPSAATVETVKDTGQLLLANAAYATEIPGLELDKLTPKQREDLLKKLNTEHCTCGCGLTVAQCRINDPDCKVSLPLAQKMLDAAKR